MYVAMLESGTLLEITEAEVRRINFQNYQSVKFDSGAILNPRKVSYVGDESIIDGKEHTYNLVMSSGSEINLPEAIAKKLTNRIGKEFGFVYQGAKINCAHIIMITPTETEKKKIEAAKIKREKEIAKEVKKRKAKVAKEKANAAKAEADTLNKKAKKLELEVAPESLMFPKE